MLRILKNKIKVVIEQEIADSISETIARLKHQVSDGLETLSKVAEDYDEVRIDKDGNLHCKNIAAVAADDKEEEVTP